MGRYSICGERPELNMPRPHSEDTRWRAIWMKEKERKGTLFKCLVVLALETL